MKWLDKLKEDFSSNSAVAVLVAHAMDLTGQEIRATIEVKCAYVSLTFLFGELWLWLSDL